MSLDEKDGPSIFVRNAGVFELRLLMCDYILLKLPEGCEE
jgi:hypothetical protein